MWYYCFVVKRFYPEHLKRRRQRLIVVTAGFILLVFLGLGLWFYKKESSKVSWKSYTDNELGVELSYPETFVKDKISDEDKKARIVFRATRKEPSALFSLRYEDGLGLLKTFGGKDILANLVAEIDRRYPDRFPDYKKENYKESVVANEKTAQFDFSYLGTDGETRIRQRFVVVVKDTAAYYLSCQAPEKEFFKSEKDFDRMINSIEFIN